jgi:Asp-tRNA(Asn)/Glu-tRNA(Gln) amidotransferase A subunit family amidase
VVPLNLASDIAGPMARTVADAVAVFQVITGPDANDPVTASSQGRATPDYRAALDVNGLRGARVGVLTQAYLTSTTDTEVLSVFRRALGELRAAGATVVDSVMLPELDSLRRSQSGGCNQFRWDVEHYLAAAGAPIASVDSILRSRRFHPSIEGRLQAALAVTQPPDSLPGCASRDRFRAGLRTAVLRQMDAQRLDALVYPTWSNPPRLIGDLNTPHGDNNQLFSPSTGFPAITVPMGHTREVLPAGLQFFGRPWDEVRLIRLAYAYEQATRHRRRPGYLPSAPR